MLLGRKTHTAGNSILYSVDYSNWLQEGESLSSGAVAMSADFTATVTDIVISEVRVTPSGDLIFRMAGGSADETFTLDVSIVNSRGEDKNDTVGFDVVDP